MVLFGGERAKGGSWQPAPQPWGFCPPSFPPPLLVAGAQRSAPHVRCRLLVVCSAGKPRMITAAHPQPRCVPRPLQTSNFRPSTWRASAWGWRAAWPTRRSPTRRARQAAGAPRPRRQQPARGAWRRRAARSRTRRGAWHWRGWSVGEGLLAAQRAACPTRRREPRLGPAPCRPSFGLASPHVTTSPSAASRCPACALALGLPLAPGLLSSSTSPPPLGIVLCTGPRPFSFSLQGLEMYCLGRQGQRGCPCQLGNRGRARVPAAAVAAVGGLGASAACAPTLLHLRMSRVPAPGLPNEPRSYLGTAGRMVHAERR